MSLELAYFYGSEVEQYSFYRIPKVLLTDRRYKSVSMEAKVLYGLMLDRMGLSVRNGWLDSEGRVYIYFTLEDALAMLGCGKDIYSSKGTYGTAGFMTKKELKGVLDLVPNIRKHPGIILGEIDGEAICVPLKTRFNGNLAVYGASGSKKTRAFCMNMILQSAARRSSLIICDPKSGATRS